MARLAAAARAGEAAACAALAAAYVACRAAPAGLVYPLTGLLGDLAFAILPRRRRLAIANLAAACGTELDATSIRRVARLSFRSFLLTALPEPARLLPALRRDGAAAWIRRRSPELVELFDRARRIHEAARGCVFVTPHLGNWELLPDIAGTLGVPLAVAVRPLDNRYLERWLARSRRSSGQVFVAKRNSLLALRHHLARGRSLGLLADQATHGGVAVPFFGRPAPTSPIPAVLAVEQQRPLVVVACIRTGPLRFTGHMGEPIWPGPSESEKAEILRLTAAMNGAMEEVIRRHPEQYLWMHDRWKPAARP